MRKHDRSVRIDDEDWQLLRQMAADQGRPIAEVIRNAVHEHVTGGIRVTATDIALTLSRIDMSGSPVTLAERLYAGLTARRK